MKVLMINGSPHEHGCTDRALREIAAQLAADGVESEIFWIGSAPVASCLACGMCRKTGFCAINDRLASLPEVEDYDGFVFGSPVHYAEPAGGMMAFMGRLFYQNAGAFEGKPAACVVSCRRAGSTSALEALWKFPTYAGMYLVGSQYWPMVHGNTPAEAEKDEEGMQIMRTLGRNMSYLLRCLEAGRAAGVKKAPREARVGTNFIR